MPHTHPQPKKPPIFDEMSELVLDSDLIYVGGGNTYKMMKIWRRFGLDTVLAEAASRGTVLSGLSAGAICWFRYGRSDSRYFSSAEWNYIRVSGLGLINAVYCPYYHSQKRESNFSQLITKRGGIGIACDNNAAIEIVGERCECSPILRMQKHTNCSNVKEALSLPNCIQTVSMPL